MNKYGSATLDRTRAKDYQESARAREMANDLLIEMRKLGFIGFRSLLDIGCGLGLFLEYMKPFFSEVQGVEISESLVRFCQESGLNVLRGRLTDLKFPAESFDVVTMWDVIEHLSDPMGYLREIWNILRKGGILAISTPNFSSLVSRIVRQKWLVLNPPEHLFYFTPKTLTSMLKKANFTVIKIKTLDMDIFNIYRALNFISFDRRDAWHQRNILYSRLKKRAIWLLLRRRANQILSKSYLGDSMRAYAYKTNFQ